MNFRCKMRGNDCHVSTKPMKQVHGLCEKSDIVEISLDAGLNKASHQKRIEVYIHEALHACFWDMDEEAITESSADIARYLIRLGVRCQQTSKKKERQGAGLCQKKERD